MQSPIEDQWKASKRFRMVEFESRVYFKRTAISCLVTLSSKALEPQERISYLEDHAKRKKRKIFLIQKLERKHERQYSPQRPGAYSGT